VSDDFTMIHMMEALEATALGNVIGDGASYIPSIAVRRSMMGVEGRSFLRIRMQSCREENQYLLCRNETKPFDGSRNLVMTAEPSERRKSTTTEDLE
jgi:hypothetical protein